MVSAHCAYYTGDFYTAGHNRGIGDPMQLRIVRLPKNDT